jgi:hypothetical protein
VGTGEAEWAGSIVGLLCDEGGDCDNFYISNREAASPQCLIATFR